MGEVEHVDAPITVGGCKELTEVGPGQAGALGLHRQQVELRFPMGAPEVVTASLWCVVVAGG